MTKSLKVQGGFLKCYTVYHHLPCFRTMRIDPNFLGVVFMHSGSKEIPQSLQIHIIVVFGIYCCDIQDDLSS